MARVRLSPADLEGAQILDTAPPPRAAAPGPGRVRLSKADLDGASFLDDAAASPPAAEAPQVGKLESFFRAAAQSATFGFADEIVGGLESAVTSKTYDQARDESRKNFKDAREANPWTSFAGDIAGTVATSFVPGVGIAKGASVAQLAGKAALQGAAQGVGDSEKTDLGGQLFDAATGAVIGGGTAGVVGGLMRGAPKRAVDRAVGDITDGATATMRDRVVGKGGSKVDDVMAAMADTPAIKAARGDAQKLVVAIDESMERVGARLDAIYTKAEAATKGIRVVDVVNDIEGIARRLAKDPGKADLARAVQQRADDIRAAWLPEVADDAVKIRAPRAPREPVRDMVQEDLPMPGAKEIKRIKHGEGGRFEKADPIPGYAPQGRAEPYQTSMFFGDKENWLKTTSGKDIGAPSMSRGEPTVTAQQLRVLAKDLGEVAFRGSPAVSPTQAKAVVRDLWGGIKGLIDKNVDEAAGALGDGRGAKELRALNGRMSTLMNMHQAALYKATREATESTRLKDRVSQGLDVAFALSDPTGAFLAKKAYDWAGKHAVRAADDRLAQLVTAARNGSTKAEIVQRAIEFGMAPAVGEALYRWSAKTLGGGYAATEEP